MKNEMTTEDLMWNDPSIFGSVEADVFFDEVEDHKEDIVIVREYINTLTKEERVTALAQLVKYNNN